MLAHHKFFFFELQSGPLRRFLLSLVGSLVIVSFFSFRRTSPPPPHCATQPIVGVYFTALYRALASSRTRLLDHTQLRATVGRTPLNEWSVRCRDIYLKYIDNKFVPSPVNRLRSVRIISTKFSLSVNTKPWISYHVLARMYVSVEGDLLGTLIAVIEETDKSSGK